MNFTFYVAVWAVLALSVLGLALYRKLIMLHEEDGLVHLAAGEERLIPHQVALAEKIKTIDSWGKTLTVVTVASGFWLAATFLYNAWERSLIVR